LKKGSNEPCEEKKKYGEADKKTFQLLMYKTIKIKMSILSYINLIMLMHGEADKKN
jgi:hypothetical protein